MPSNEVDTLTDQKCFNMEHICKNCGKPIKAAGEACTGCVGPDANDRATAQQEGTAERITLRGYVLILRHAEGSKSESYAPHLVVDSVKIHLLHVPGTIRSALHPCRDFMVNM